MTLFEYTILKVLQVVTLLFLPLCVYVFAMSGELIKEGVFLFITLISYKDFFEGWLEKRFIK
jgi:hypothetical protein